MFVSGKGWVKKGGTKNMNKILTFVERGGKARSIKIGDVSAREIVPHLEKNVSKKSMFMIDEGRWYKKFGEKFAKYEMVNYSRKEYVRGEITINIVEGYFSIFKCGMIGIYQYCGEQYL